MFQKSQIKEIVKWWIIFGAFVIPFVYEFFFENNNIWFLICYNFTGRQVSTNGKPVVPINWKLNKIRVPKPVHKNSQYSQTNSALSVLRAEVQLYFFRGEVIVCWFFCAICQDVTTIFFKICPAATSLGGSLVWQHMVTCPFTSKVIWKPYWKCSIELDWKREREVFARRAAATAAAGPVSGAPNFAQRRAPSPSGRLGRPWWPGFCKMTAPYEPDWRIFCTSHWQKRIVPKSDSGRPERRQRHLHVKSFCAGP